MRKPVAMLTVILLMVAVRVHAQCGLIANLPPVNIVDIQDDTEFARRFQSWLSTSHFSDSSSDQGAEYSALLPIADAFQQVGFSWNKATRERFSREFTQRWRSDERFRETFRLAIRQLDQNLVNKLAACLALKGLHLWVEPGARAEDFVLRLQWNSPGDPPTVRVDAPVFSPSTVTCNPQLRNGTVLTGAGRRLLCTRSDSLPITIVVNASVEPILDNNLHLPTILRQEQPCAELHCGAAPPHSAASPPVYRNYTVRVYTSDVRNAGTDARVYLTIDGSEHDLGERYINAVGNDNERGEMTTHHLNHVRRLGELCRIRIRHDNSGDNPGWHVNQIVIDDGAGHTWMFPMNRWLATDEGDHRIDIWVGAQPRPSRC